MVGCALSFAAGIAASVVDCSIDPDGCVQTIALNTVGALIGCIPVVGGFAGAAFTCFVQGGLALNSARECLPPGSSSVQTQGVQAFSGAVTPTPDNLFFQQARLWADAASVYALVLGSSVWTTITGPDLPKFNALMQRIADDMAPSSDGGIPITSAQRADLTAMPLPTGISETLRSSLLDRMHARLHRQHLAR